MLKVLEVKGATISVAEKQLEQPAKSEFERLLEESYVSKFEQGDIVKGHVVRIERDGVLVDVGGKSEGFVPVKEISNIPVDRVEDAVKVGDELEFYILREENENGQLTLSLKRVAQARGWVLLEQQKKNDDTIRARISAVVKGGVVVDVYGLRGFVPASQLRVKGTTPEELIGMEIPMKILETDTKRNKLILSQTSCCSRREGCAAREDSEHIWKQTRKSPAKLYVLPTSARSSTLVVWTACCLSRKSLGSASRIHPMYLKVGRHGQHQST